MLIFLYLYPLDGAFCFERILKGLLVKVFTISDA